MSAWSYDIENRMRKLGHTPNGLTHNQYVVFSRCVVCGVYAIVIKHERSFGTALESPCDPHAVNKTIKFER